jgi:hypothetical protein
MTTTLRLLLTNLAYAGGLLLTAALLRWAEEAGLVSGEAGRRIVQVTIGFGGALYGNAMPKMITSAITSVRKASLNQAVLRTGGWSMTLAGLAYAGLWAFAPLAFARVASMLVIIAAVAVMAGYTIWAITACRRAGRTTAG